MSVPVVIGLRLEQARTLLGAEAVSIAEVKQTRPPGQTPEGPLRVVRQRALAGGVELTVAPSVPLAETEHKDGSR